MARHFRGSGHIVRFIEYMDVGATNGWRMDDVVPAARDRGARSIASSRWLPPTRTTAARSPSAGATRDGGGEIGVIASVTQAFCRDCTRARLSTDGKLYTCLFATAGLRPARAHAQRRERRAASRRDRRRSGGSARDRYSEIRTADDAAAQRRSRCATSADRRPLTACMDKPLPSRPHRRRAAGDVQRSRDRRARRDARSRRSRASIR